MSKNRILICLFLFHIFSYAQNNLNHGTYLTNDKLGYITIYPNNTFGYVSFFDTSPYLESKKKKSFIKGFLIKEQGAGTYIFDKKNIELKFTDEKTPIDSLKIEKKTNTSDSLTITILPIYNSNMLGKSELTITNEELNLDLWTTEKISFKVLKEKIPFKINTNFQAELIIDEMNDYIIKIYINTFRIRNSSNLASKKFKLSTLTYLK